MAGLKPRSRTLQIWHMLVVMVGGKNPTDLVGKRLLTVNTHPIHDRILNLTDK